MQNNYSREQNFLRTRILGVIKNIDKIQIGILKKKLELQLLNISYEILLQKMHSGQGFKAKKSCKTYYYAS